MTKLEMIRLALKGWKPGEIAELQELEKLADSEDEYVTSELIEDSQESDPEELPEEQHEENENNTAEIPQNSIDYKAQYEEAMKKLAELQQLNIQQNLAGKEKNEEEVMASLVHKFIK